MVFTCIYKMEFYFYAYSSVYVYLMDRQQKLQNFWVCVHL